MGLLRDNRVLSSNSYSELAGKVNKATGYEIARDYLGEGKKQPYADWVKEYVSGTENVSKTE